MSYTRFADSFKGPIRSEQRKLPKIYDRGLTEDYATQLGLGIVGRDLVCQGMEDFYDHIGKVLQEGWVAALRRSVQRFIDLLEGKDEEGIALADELVQQRPFRMWLEEIVVTIEREYKLGPAAGSGDGVPFLQLPVKQITLVGDNLPAAWAANQDVQVELPPPARNFDPTTSSSCPVYHGTTIAPASSNELAVTNFLQKGLTLGMARANELSPSGALYTSFAPFRSFLWALFTSEITNPRLSTSQTERIKNTWTYGGQEFKGVLLLKYKSQTPTIPGLTSMVITEASGATEWEAKMRYFRNHNFFGCLDEVWNLTPSNLHFGTTDNEFPDIIHSVETEKIWERLKPFGQSKHLPENPYRTAYTTPQAEQWLKEKLECAYAVTWTEPDEHISRVAGSGKRKTLGKEVGQFVQSPPRQETQGLEDVFNILNNRNYSTYRSFFYNHI